jgi:type III secretion protein Q
MPDMDAPADSAVTESAAAKAVPVALARASVTQAQARLSRIVGRGLAISLPDQGVSLSLRFADGETGGGNADALTLQGAFGAIELAQGPRFVRALSGIDISAELAAGDARWEWLQAALVARLHGTPFAGAERIARGSLPASAETVMLRLTLRSAGHAITTLARADAVSWIAFLREDKWKQERLPFSDFADVPYEKTIHVGHHTLPHHALNGIGAGDIFIVDNAAFGTRGAGHIQLGILRASVRYQEPNAFRISGIRVDLDIAAQEADEQEGVSPILHAPHCGGPDNQDDTPVTLDFELGRIRMALDSLRTLQPDSIVMFDGSSACIAIRCNKRLLGRGELVDVDSRLGIRVLEWGLKS